MTGMTGMTATETASYITHHLKLAGRSDTLFTDDAVTLIHQVSRGLPRAVNNLAVQVPSAVQQPSRRSRAPLPALSSRSYSARISTLYFAVYMRRVARSSTRGSGTSSNRTACPPGTVASSCVIELDLQLSPSGLSSQHC